MMLVALRCAEGTLSDPLAEYHKRLSSYAARIASENRRHIYLGNAKLATIVVEIAGVWLVLSRQLFAAYWLLLPLAAYLALAVTHEFILRAKNRAEVASAFYQRGIARIEDRWPGTGSTGERFLERKDLYAEDLDIFGRGSLFELLSQARLPMGEDRLAEFLSSPPELPKILERQQMVAELRDSLDLREHLAVTGEALGARLDPRSLTAWAESSTLLPGGAWRGIAVLLSLTALAGIILCLTNRVYYPLLAVLIVEIPLRRWLRPRAETVMRGVSCNAEGLLLFAQILARLEREKFTAPPLRAISDQLRDNAEGTHHPLASQAVRKLARIVAWIDGEHSLAGHLAELPFLYSIQVAYVAETWRREYGRHLRAWAAAAGEMEALLSLAGYAYEHPQDPFPQFEPATDTGTAPRFHGDQLGHPLIPAARCVRNSVSLDASTRILLVSGSNMSGKSTFLRTVGVNAVLAMAGAPIRGASLQLSPLAIGTRIRSGDSLQEGRSNFYTEILHIRRVFDVLRQSQRPLLFLFDELLEGTNSHDRRIGAQSLLEALLKRGAIGIVTTHDLALTEIGTSLGTSLGTALGTTLGTSLETSRGAPLRNMHFADQVRDGKMFFDYQLREGVVTKSNALELMRLVGLDM
jgi:MutS-like protein